MSVMSVLVLRGPENDSREYWFHSCVNIRSKSVKQMLEYADKMSVARVNVEMSGRYYDRRPDGWYETSDFEVCDRAHGLPPEGRKISGV